MILVVDTNVFLNVARCEEEFFRASAQLLEAIRDGKVAGLASSAVIIEIKWTLYGKGEYAKAERATSLIEEIVEIASIDKNIAHGAIDLKISKRLELLDSIHAVTAILNRAVFVTRDSDLRGKIEDMVVVQTPEEILKQFTEKSSAKE